MRIRVYGPERGNGSWPRVAQGLCEGLRENDALAGFVPSDNVGHDLDDALPPGFDAPIGIHVGPPTIASIMRGRGQHKHRLALIAVNSTWAPALAMQSLERDTITGYVTPSPWASSVLRNHTKFPVYTWQHGVSPSFANQYRAPLRDHWRVLHMASTHSQRKGTAQLIAAWGELMGGGDIPRDSRIRLVCDGPRGFFDAAIAAAANKKQGVADSFEVSPRLDMTKEGTVHFYQEHDLIVQPSRAEGFGLVPLEARVAGVPVAMTTCTGHAEHAKYGVGRTERDRVLHGADGGLQPPIDEPRGVVWIGSGDNAPIDDGPGAQAPTVSVDAVSSALHFAYRRRVDLALEARSEASSVLDRYSWKSATKRFLDACQEALT